MLRYLTSSKVTSTLSPPHSSTAKSSLNSCHLHLFAGRWPTWPMKVLSKRLVNRKAHTGGLSLPGWWWPTPVCFARGSLKGQGQFAPTPAMMLPNRITPKSDELSKRLCQPTIVTPASWVGHWNIPQESKGVWTLHCGYALCYRVHCSRHHLCIYRLASFKNQRIKSH